MLYVDRIKTIDFNRLAMEVQYGTKFISKTLLICLVNSNLLRGVAAYDEEKIYTYITRFCRNDHHNTANFSSPSAHRGLD